MGSKQKSTLFSRYQRFVGAKSMITVGPRQVGCLVVPQSIHWSRSPTQMLTPSLALHQVET